MEFKNVLPHAINISGTMNGGYLMEVGCARFAYGDSDDMLELVKAYLDDPEGMVKKYNKAMDKYGGPSSGCEVAAPSLVEREQDQCDSQAEAPEGANV